MKKFKIKELCIAFVIMLYFSSILRAHQLSLSFDSLFPVTWYQKALQSSLVVWQQLVDFIQNGDVINNGAKKIAFDGLLGRLAFVQFCLQRIKQDGGVVMLDEDRDYLVMVLNKIKDLVEVVGGVGGVEDEGFVECIFEIIGEMQRKFRCYKS